MMVGVGGDKVTFCVLVINLPRPSVCSEATTRTGTAREAAWSSPPPTCTSWRAGSSPITGPYHTRERSPWASASSPPAALHGTVRERRSSYFTFQNTNHRGGGMVSLDRRVVFTTCRSCGRLVSRLIAYPTKYRPLPSF